MTFQVFDMLGKEIKVDDLVAGAFEYGSSPAIRIGKIVEFKITHPRDYAKPNYYLRIDWKLGRGLPSKPSLISVWPNEKSNFLKVTVDGIN